MTPDETRIYGRLNELRLMLAARDGKPGFKRNVEAIRAEIARLEAQK